MCVTLGTLSKDVRRSIYSALPFKKSLEYHSFIVDEHVIYAFVFWLFIAADAGKYKGLDGRKVK